MIPTSELEKRWTSLPLPVGSFIGLIIALAAVTAMAIGSWQALQSQREAATSVTRTLDVIRQIDVIVSAAKDAETGQRGYLITGNESYLEPYAAARAAMPGYLRRLRSMVEDNDDQLARIASLERFSAAKFEDLAATIELRRKGNQAGSMSIVLAERGRQAMDGLRATAAEMTAEEQALLALRQGDWDRARTITSLVSTGGAVVLLVLIVAAATVMSRDYRRRETQDWLRSGQIRLAERLQGEQRLETLGENALNVVAAYLGAAAGAIYVVERRGRYRRIAGYGVAAETPPLDDQVADSLIGQAARENRSLHFTSVPADHLKVSSGLGQSSPAQLIVAPASVDGVVYAVMELAFFSSLDPAALELTTRMSESLGVAVRSAKDRSRLEELLGETQRQSEELQAQQEELRVNNEELEEQSEALRETQARLELQQAELEQSNSQLEEQTGVLTRQKDALERGQAALAEKSMEVERASRYKSEFLANMSHELRTPLNSSLILAKLLADNREGTLSAEQVKFAQTIYSAGNDLLDLINDILDLSKIEAGKMEVRPETVRPARMVDALAQVFQPIAAQKGIGFQTRIDDDAPRSIETDAQRLQQILKNLLSNAFKFTDRGDVTLRVAAEPGGRIRFDVRDTGIGIPAAQHEIIFEAFRQADGTTNRRYGGTGLGLSISRDLARLLGGEVRLESAEGQGSVFSLVLPAVYVPVEVPPPTFAPAVAAAVIAAAPPPPPVRRRPAAPFDDDRASIGDASRVLLVVEDDEAFARILYDLAHELGFRCLVAGGADEGIDLALQFNPTAIVLDMNLPDHSGLTVLDRLKRNPMTRHIPVQVASVEDYTQAALEMGAAGYMLKPVTRESLIDALSKLETRLSQGLRSVLVVEDDPVQRESICRLLDANDVRTIPVATAAAALEQLRTSTHDCMVLDISLPDASGFDLLEKMAQEDQYSFPPVIVYTGRSLSADEEQRLRRYSKSIIIKGARSPERLLDEVTLFLHQVEANLPADRRKMLQAARSRDAAFENRNVLVVEDDVRNIFALSSVLEPRGATLTIARNGREALEILESAARIDMVLMDIMMPEMDGFEAMREIRKRPQLARLPIIALTAKAMRDDQEQCLAAGASDYIAKPIDVEQLLSLMRVWMPK